jgi:hypothetical protein
MAQAVNRRPLTVQARVLSQDCLCDILGGRSGSGKGFILSASCHQHHRYKRRRLTFAILNVNIYIGISSKMSIMEWGCVAHVGLTEGQGTCELFREAIFIVFTRDSVFIVLESLYVLW